MIKKKNTREELSHFLIPPVMTTETEEQCLPLIESLPDVEELQIAAEKKIHLFDNTSSLDDACRRLESARRTDAKHKYRMATLVFEEAERSITEQVTRFRQEALATLINLSGGLTAAVQRNPPEQFWTQYMKYTRMEKGNPMYDWADDAVAEGVKLFRHLILQQNKGYRVYIIEEAVDYDNQLNLRTCGLSVGVYWSTEPSELEEETRDAVERQAAEREVAAVRMNRQRLPDPRPMQGGGGGVVEEAEEEVVPVATNGQALLAAPAGTALPSK